MFVRYKPTTLIAKTNVLPITQTTLIRSANKSNKQKIVNEALAAVKLSAGGLFLDKAIYMITKADRTNKYTIQLSLD